MTKKLEPRIFKSNKYGYHVPYRLYIPKEYDKSQKYPLVLVLHGGGERGKDNKKQLTIGVKTFISPEVQSIQKTFVLAPQCPKNSQWLNTKFGKPPFDNYVQDDIPESDAMKMIIDIINLLKREFNIDERRIYVTGYSMGGSGTWDIITRYPDIFAAAVPITGVSDPSKAKKIARMPIWAFHGSKDRITPINVTKKMVHELRIYGSTCRFTEYNDIGHDSWNAAYNEKEMINWLFMQLKKS